MPRFRSELAGLAALVASAALVGGCGVDVNFDTPHDHVTFIINGQQTTVAMDGTVSVQIDGVPELSYSGPAGCAGHYFVDDDSEIYFRYTAKRAYLLRGSRLYTFNEPPRRGGKDIVWSHTFGPDKITILANCPLPSAAHVR
jgi:hypothetical protein